MKATTHVTERGKSEEFTVESYKGKEIVPETVEPALVRVDKVISKVLADLKRCGEEGKAVLRQML